MASTILQQISMNSQTICESRWQILLFSLQLLNNLFAVLKNILELEERAKRNLEFSKWIKRKRRGSQRNLVDVSVSSICYLSHVSAKLHYKSILEIKKPEEVLVEANNNYLFLSKYLNSFSWHSPFNVRWF